MSGAWSAARALRVVGVNGSPPEGGQSIFHKTGLVERIRVDGHLHVVFVGHRQAVVDGRPGCCPNPRAA